MCLSWLFVSSPLPPLHYNLIAGVKQCTFSAVVAKYLGFSCEIVNNTQREIVCLYRCYQGGKWPGTDCSVHRFNLMDSAVLAADCFAVEGHSCPSWQQVLRQEEGIVLLLPVNACDLPAETIFSTSEKRKLT